MAFDQILIFGAGRIGMVLGGFLAQAGKEVHLVGRETNVRAIQEEGIRITGLWGDHRVSNLTCFTQLPNDRKYDLIIIAVRSFQTREAVTACLPAADENTIFLSTQNGYGNLETITELAGEHRSLGARVLFGVQSLEPGSVRVTVFGDSIRIGCRGNRILMETVERLAKIIKDSGVPTEATDRIDHYLWEKILYNCCLNPLGAILDVPYGALAESEETREIMDKIVDEAFPVFRSLDLKLEWEKPEDFLETFYGKMVPPTAAHRSSMLQDLKQGRQTEIESLNGAISRLAGENESSAPINETVTRQIRFLELR